MIDQIRIGGMVYQVKEKEDLHTVDPEDRKVMLNGNIHYSDLTISLHQELAPQLSHAVLMHEAIHAILHQAGHDEHNEDHVVALGYGLVALIRDNPDLVKLITGGDDGSPSTA